MPGEGRNAMPNRKAAAVFALTLGLTMGMASAAEAQPTEQALCPSTGYCYFHYIEKEYYTGHETMRWVNHPQPASCYYMDRAVAGQNWTNKTIYLSRTSCADGAVADAQVAPHSSWRDESRPYYAFITP